MTVALKKKMKEDVYINLFLRVTYYVYIVIIIIYDLIKFSSYSNFDSETNYFIQSHQLRKNNNIIRIKTL